MEFPWGCSTATACTEAPVTVAAELLSKVLQLVVSCTLEVSRILFLLSWLVLQYAVHSWRFLMGSGTSNLWNILIFYKGTVSFWWKKMSYKMDHFDKYYTSTFFPQALVSYLCSTTVVTVKWSIVSLRVLCTACSYCMHGSCRLETYIASWRNLGAYTCSRTMLCIDDNNLTTTMIWLLFNFWLKYVLNQQSEVSVNNGVYDSQHPQMQEKLYGQYFL